MPTINNRRRARVVKGGLSSKQQVTVRKIAKKVAMGIPEVKAFGFIDENRQLLHNKTDYLPNFLECKQGTADPNDVQGASNRLVRLGDEFYLKSVNMRLWLSNKDDRPNVMYKCFMFWYDSSVTLSDAVCFFTQQNKMLDRINNESISIIDQKTIFSGPSYSGNAALLRERLQLCTLRGNWKGRKITYDEGGTVPKKRTIGTAVVCYDAFGTLQSDNIASYAYNARIKLIDP